MYLLNINHQVQHVLKYIVYYQLAAKLITLYYLVQNIKHEYANMLTRSC